MNKYGSSVYCSKCGNILPHPLKMIKVDEYDALGRIMPIYGTACCKSRTFKASDIHWDYADRQPIGKRYGNPNLNQVVKLCCSIGKSPFSIRKGYEMHNFIPTDYYYFEVKSTKHIQQLDTLFNKEIAT